MANYCSNELKIMGDEKELKDFMSKFKDKEEHIEFNNIVHRPEEFDVGEKWYEWNIANWGTKWSPYEDSVCFNCEEDELVEVYFDTAWSPCTEFIKNASALYPNLLFILKYEEGGCCFMGVAKAQGGNLEDKYLQW